MKGLYPIAVASLAAGCATTEPARVVNYSCDRNQQITVEFAGDTATITSASGAPIVMQRKESASGFWYESPTHSLRGKGDEATYTIGRMAPMSCTANLRQPR